jgi:choline kinase
VYGEFIGVAKFNRWGAAVLINEMDRIIREGNPWTFLVEAFEHLASKGYHLSIENIKGLLWSDNDTMQDLKITREKILPAIKKKNPPG